MRFEEKEDNVFICCKCGRKISNLDDFGFEDEHLCSGCSARDKQEFVKNKCKLCKKPLCDEIWYYFIDDEEIYAHIKCVEKLPEEKQDAWSNEYY